MCGQGDVPGAAAYHADLTRAFGVAYVWRGRVTSVVGQDVPRRLAGIVRRGHLLPSARTLAKEAAKGLLARAGSEKYAMHRDNAVLRSVTLRDGGGAREFLRCNPHWAAVDEGETADGLAEVLTRLHARRPGPVGRRLRPVHAPGQDQGSRPPVRRRHLRGARAPGRALARGPDPRHHHPPPARRAARGAGGARHERPGRVGRAAHPGHVRGTGGRSRRPDRVRARAGARPGLRERHGGRVRREPAGRDGSGERLAALAPPGVPGMSVRALWRRAAHALGGGRSLDRRAPRPARSAVLEYGRRRFVKSYRAHVALEFARGEAIHRAAAASGAFRAPAPLAVLEYDTIEQYELFEEATQPEPDSR